MATEAITGRVQRVLLEALNVDVPSPDTDLIESGVLDSLALVELLFAIEGEFDVSIALDDLAIDSLRSARGIAALVENAQGASDG